MVNGIPNWHKPARNRLTTVTFKRQKRAVCRSGHVSRIYRILISKKNVDLLGARDGTAKVLMRQIRGLCSDV